MRAVTGREQRPGTGVNAAAVPPVPFSHSLRDAEGRWGRRLRGQRGLGGRPNMADSCGGGLYGVFPLRAVPAARPAPAGHCCLSQGAPAWERGPRGVLAWIPQGEELPAALWLLPGLGAQAAVRVLQGPFPRVTHTLKAPRAPGAPLCDRLRRWAA